LHQNLTNKATIYWDPRNIVQLFTNNPPAVANYLTSLVVLTIVVFVLYEIHLWQLGLREDQQRDEELYKAKKREKIAKLKKRRELLIELRKVKRELKNLQ